MKALNSSTTGSWVGTRNAIGTALVCDAVQTLKKPDKTVPAEEIVHKQIHSWYSMQMMNMCATLIGKPACLC